jgi:hypothetical protein
MEPSATEERLKIGDKISHPKHGDAEIDDVFDQGGASPTKMVTVAVRRGGSTILRFDAPHDEIIKYKKEVRKGGKR